MTPNTVKVDLGRIIFIKKLCYTLICSHIHWDILECIEDVLPHPGSQAKLGPHIDQWGIKTKGEEESIFSCTKELLDLKKVKESDKRIARSYLIAIFKKSIAFKIKASVYKVSQAKVLKGLLKDQNIFDYSKYMPISVVSMLEEEDPINEKPVSLNPSYNYSEAEENIMHTQVLDSVEEIKTKLGVKRRDLINIGGVSVSIEELEEDVEASLKKGYSGEYAFTPETVAALLNRIKELS
jgi:hypothetical protein